MNAINNFFLEFGYSKEDLLDKENYQSDLIKKSYTLDVNNLTDPNKILKNKSLLNSDIKYYENIILMNIDAFYDIDVLVSDAIANFLKLRIRDKLKTTFIGSNFKPCNVVGEKLQNIAIMLYDLHENRNHLPYVSTKI